MMTVAITTTELMQGTLKAAQMRWRDAMAEGHRLLDDTLDAEEADRVYEDDDDEEWDEDAEAEDEMDEMHGQMEEAMQDTWTGILEACDNIGVDHPRQLGGVAPMDWQHTVVSDFPLAFGLAPRDRGYDTQCKYGDYPYEFTDQTRPKFTLWTTDDYSWSLDLDEGPDVSICFGERSEINGADHECGHTGTVASCVAWFMEQYLSRSAFARKQKKLHEATLVLKSISTGEQLRERLLPDPKGDGEFELQHQLLIQFYRDLLEPLAQSGRKLHIGLGGPGDFANEEKLTVYHGDVEGYSEWLDCGPGLMFEIDTDRMEFTVWDLLMDHNMPATFLARFGKVNRDGGTLPHLNFDLLNTDILELAVKMILAYK